MNMIKKRTVKLILISFSCVLVISMGVIAEASTIPEWVKNNAKWWSDGQIAEADYISSLQYLINQGIIQMPITEVNAASSSIDNNERAHSFVVHFSGGDFGDNKIDIYTYSQFFHFSETITSDHISRFQDRPGFLLRSLPSHDKSEIYKLVDSYVNAGKTPLMFEAKVDVLDGKGSIIQSWDYRKCDIVDYATYVNDDKDEYRFGDRDEAEIRDVLVIECAGFGLDVP